jgi:hypothetical protein
MSAPDLLALDRVATRRNLAAFISDPSVGLALVFRVRPALLVGANPARISRAFAATDWLGQATGDQNRPAGIPPATWAFELADGSRTTSLGTIHTATAALLNALVVDELGIADLTAAEQVRLSKGH